MRPVPETATRDADALVPNKRRERKKNALLRIIRIFYTYAPAWCGHIGKAQVQKQ